MLSHYDAPSASPTLSPSTLRAALSFAEAILPGSGRIPAADESTVARTEHMVRGMGEVAFKAWGAALVTLDQAARLSEGKPFHALSRARQEALLAGWETSTIVAGPLQLLSQSFKAAHFDLRRPYVASGGALRVLQAETPARWESQIKPASQWPDDRNIECDVVVIGTGPGGAVVGRELADRGFAVVFVEEGKRHARRDFVGSFVHAHATFYRNVIALGTPPMMVLMGKIVGGSSAVNGGTCLRPAPFIHGEWCERIGGNELSQEAMEPYFQRAEHMLMVAPSERRYIGPIADVFDRGGRALGWRVGPVPRNAVGCQGVGFCDFGCSSGARRSVDIAYLPGALERGALLLSELRAERIAVEGGRAVGVDARDAAGRFFRVRGKAVVLAGGAVPTPLLLLQQGIANRSGQVGKNLSLHPSVGVLSQFDEPIEPERYIPQGYGLTEFLSQGILVLAAQPDPTVAPMMIPYTGHRLMRALDAVPHMAGFGVLIRDQSRGRVWFNVAGHPAVTYSVGRDDVELLHRAVTLTAELCWAAGARRVYPGLLGVDPLESRADIERFKRQAVSASQLAMVSYHPLGTCRMGRDPRTSVVDPDHQAHDVRGLFIVDGSTVPAPPGVNPQLIIMAMATRAAERIAARL